MFLRRRKPQSGVLRAIFIAPAAGQAMQSLQSVAAVARAGLTGDRYAARDGHWVGPDACEVTLIESEALAMLAAAGMRVAAGEHRRNLVTAHIALTQLAGRRFRIGEVVFEYRGPRPPCSYLETLTQPGMTRALAGRSGICARIVESGTLRVGDAIRPV